MTCELSTRRFYPERPEKSLETPLQCLRVIDQKWPLVVELIDLDHFSKKWAWHLSNRVMKMLLTMCCFGCNKLRIRRYTCSRTWRILTKTTCFRGAHAFIMVPFNDILTVQTCECVAQFLRMDPNLLRECAQRLIETADFIRGSGVNGGSVASSSAPSNTSNTPGRNTSIEIDHRKANR